jgi:hypothetical protein
MFKSLAALLLLVAASNAVELDGSTFEDGVAGKAAFVKFQAPW